MKKSFGATLGREKKLSYLLEKMTVQKLILWLRKQPIISLNTTSPYAGWLSYSTNAQSRVFEDSLLHRGIPYVIIGGLSFYQRREIKDILAFLRMAHSGSDYMAFLRTINLPKRGFGDAAVEKIRHGANLERLTLLAYCEALVKNQPLQNSCKLSVKQKESLAEYVGIIHELHQLSKQQSIKDLVKAAIEQTKYMDFLLEDKETYLDRKFRSVDHKSHRMGKFCFHTYFRSFFGRALTKIQSG